ncbi:carboxypeptidase regulatory-like domain-containing protein [Anabaena sp. UHCC 0253]|uniref:carboxypeptidase-like regulatory domain-containing protein n=1 Tax=Anabaena sp. UHCC 0253 TaxID=2590019 RepID=UPI0014466B24|nr:carboxypeptidase-like regulatory domain-containing protein [Anabaena sp. UHCC 0253]MTJ53535.1 carboxypeptidase regulatory-like domain-containing protein [Anabaena sp. UHCC 0253]
MHSNINNCLKILCFFNLFSCSFSDKNTLILAAELPNKIALNEENSQKQIFIETPIENISQPEYFGDEKLPIFLTQTNSTPPKNDNFPTFIIGLNVGNRSVNDGVLVRGKVTDKDAINFENWLIPYDDVLEALKFTSKRISENEVELRSYFKVIRFDTNKLHNDPELGLVLSPKEIQDIFGIASKFDWREYAIVFDVPEVKSTNSNNIEKKPVLLTGLPKISAPDVTLSMVEQRVNLSGTTTSDLKNQGNLSAVGTIFDSSWFVRVNQSDITDSKTWQLSELQILKQTDNSDYYLGSQPTFWRSQSAGDFWGFTTIQRQGFSPFPSYGSGSVNPSQRLQPERIFGTVTGRAEPGTLARLVKNFYGSDVIAEQLVDGSGNYRFDNIPVGRQIGRNYQILLYPGGVLTAQPRIEDARFNLLPEKLSVGTSALIISGGWKRRLNNNDFLGEFTQFSGGISQRWGLTKDLTVSLGGIYDSSFQGLTELFYQPQKSPFRMTVSGLIGDDIKINTNLIWDGYPNLYATLSNDLKSTRYTLDLKMSNQFRFYSSGDLDKEKNFGLGYSSSSGNSSTFALVNVDTNARLSWILNQNLGKLFFNHRGNHTSTSSQLLYLFNPYQSLIFNYETLSSSQNANLLTAYWRYTSPSYTRYSENLWQGELGYRIGSLGTGIYGTLGTTILPGILLQARYEGVSLNSNQNSFSIQLVSSLGFQQGITPGDRQIQRFRTEGGLLVIPFLDRNSNGKRDNNEEIYNDNSEFLIVNNEVVKPSQFEIKKDRFMMRLAPGTYRVDLEPAGFPPDFQPAISTFAVKVVEGSYTPILIPLQPSYTLAGIATNAEGNPIAGAKVEAIDPNTKSSVISITNSAGVFYLEQLRQGIYQLKVNGKPAEPNTITIKADDPTLKELNLKLP